MNRRETAVLAVFVVLIGVSTAFLHRMGSAQHVGKPGVRVGSRPIHDDHGKVAGQQSVELPEEVAGFTSKEEEVTTMELNWLPRDTVYGRRFYKAPDGFQTSLSVVLMGRDRTSIHKPQYCLVGQGWQIERSEEISIPMTHPSPYNLRAMKMTLSREVKSEGRAISLRGIYLYWFVADGQLTAQHGQRMWWMARDLLTRGLLQRWAYVSYFSICRPGAEAETIGRMQSFIAETLPTFQIAPGQSAALDQPSSEMASR